MLVLLDVVSVRTNETLSVTIAWFRAFRPLETIIEEHLIGQSRCSCADLLLIMHGRNDTPIPIRAYRLAFALNPAWLCFSGTAGNGLVLTLHSLTGPKQKCPGIVHSDFGVRAAIARSTERRASQKSAGRALHGGGMVLAASPERVQTRTQ